MPISVFPNQAIITDHLADNRSIFLFDKTLVSFLIRPSSCEGNLFLFTIRHNFLIEELPAIIGIDAQDGERKERMRALDGCQNRLPTTVEEREAFSPACRDVGEGQGVEVASLRFSPTMGNQICFQKARLRFTPVLEGADGHLVFEEGSYLGGGYPAWAVFSLSAEETIRRCYAHREQLASALLGEVQMSMPLQRFNESWQKGNEPFGTDLIGGVPYQVESLLDLWSIANGTRMRTSGP